jgi:hypothetical protein
MRLQTPLEAFGLESGLAGAPGEHEPGMIKERRESPMWKRCFFFFLLEDIVLECELYIVFVAVLITVFYRVGAGSSRSA